MIKHPLHISSNQLNTLLNHLQHEAGFVYLDSASNDHVNNKVSIIAWQPLYSIQTRLNQTEVYRNNQLVERSESDPLEIVETYLNKAELNEDPALSFSGGAIGYFDYELGGRFEHLPAPKEQEIDLPNMAIGIYNKAILVCHETNQIQLIVQHDNINSVHEHLLKLSNAETDESTFSLTSDWSANMTQEQYRDKFLQVQQYLQSGDCYQINLAQRFSAKYSGSEWQAYQKLRNQNSAPFSAFMRLEQGAVLSVSPERFIEVKQGIIETKPIKGTKPRSTNESEDKALAESLQHSPKDRAENLMIVDLLRNDISKVAVPGTVNVPKLFDIESFPAVHHLVSTVTAKLAEHSSCFDLLRGAFPGGSITGAPKIRAMEIIHELEPNRRSVYCGAIGYITPSGNMDTNITIRTLVCNQGKIYCWAGGGLVADSTWQSEYQETWDKVNKILPILAEV
jgi:para-aminobenzoate synthetase component 1